MAVHPTHRPRLLLLPSRCAGQGRRSIRRQTPVRPRMKSMRKRTWPSHKWPSSLGNRSSGKGLTFIPDQSVPLFSRRRAARTFPPAGRTCPAKSKSTRGTNAGRDKPAPAAEPLLSRRNWASFGGANSNGPGAGTKEPARSMTRTHKSCLSCSDSIYRPVLDLERLSTTWTRSSLM